MLEPRNEAETIELFEAAQESLGWQIVHLQVRFPDAIIENVKGQRLTVEFEYKARNFHHHGHDPAGCDLIVCWRNNWPAAPVPVWGLQDCFSLPHPVWVREAERRLASLQDTIDNLSDELEKAKIQLRSVNVELAYLRATRMNIAGVHTIEGIGQFYTATSQEAENVDRFFHRLFSG